MLFYKRNIKFLRQMHKLTQNDLASKLDLALITIKALENKQMKPSLDTLIKLKQVFNVSIDDLIFKDLSNEGGNNDDR